MDDYFALGYIPDPDTIYEDVHKLPAAHYLLLQQGERGVQPRRYWTVPTTTRAAAEREATAELLRRLTDYTATRMVSDVPLGAFLSGGVDSSAVVAVAAGLRAKADNAPLSTFTIGFHGAEDERGYAQQVADRYRTDHRAEPTTIDYIDAARDQARVFGEPFGDVSSVPTGSVCALARRHVTVALSGDGGDEVLGGYRRYQWHRMTEAVRRLLPGPVRRGVVGRLAAAYPKLDRAPRWLRAKHTLTEISLDSALGYYRMVCKVQHDRRRAMFSGKLEAGLDGHEPSRRITDLMEGAGTEDPLLQAQYVDINTSLVGGILVKVDRASMAHGLEVRAPMLDYEFVEWGLGLPADLKMRGRQGKWVLKRAMEPLLPHEVLYRPKQGFAMSLDQQFRAGPTGCGSGCWGRRCWAPGCSRRTPSRSWWTSMRPGSSTTPRCCGCCWCSRASWPGRPGWMRRCRPCRLWLEGGRRRTLAAADLLDAVSQCGASEPWRVRGEPAAAPGRQPARDQHGAGAGAVVPVRRRAVRRLGAQRPRAPAGGAARAAGAPPPLSRAAEGRDAGGAVAAVSVQPAHAAAADAGRAAVRRD